MKDIEIIENVNLNGFGVNLASPVVDLNHSMFSINFIPAWSNIHRGANLSETIAFVEKTWKELYPAGIFNEIFLEDQLACNYTLENLIVNGFTVSLNL